MKNLSIVVPIYNEQKLLNQFLSTLLHFLKRNQARNIEILLVENGSTDNTSQILNQFKKRSSWIQILSLPRPNFGKALRKGIFSAKKQHLLILNVDWWDSRFVLKAYDLRNQADIVVASKRLRPGYDKRPIIRKFFTGLLSRSINFLFIYQGTDTHGLKFIKRTKIIPILKVCQTNEILESELLIRAQRKGFKIKELSSHIRELRPARSSFFKRSFRAAQELWLLKKIL